MPDHESQSLPPTGIAHRILERLTAVKTHVWMLRQHLHGDHFDPAEAEAHLDQMETQIDEAATLAANLQGQSSPPP